MRQTRRWIPLVFVGIACAVMVGGCSSTGGFLGHSILTEVQLNQANFEIIKSVTGESAANYFFGIGVSQGDLLGRAKRDMLHKAGLEGSQAVVNLSTDIKQTWFLFWLQKKAYVSADVIEFK
ncbi:MAG: hypothetical protein HQ559_02515 [Lentisphaerae bacterium]|nr:hypothetical protein [Lentisphaerota bacterium]